MVKVYVRRLDASREVVKEIEVGHPSPRNHQTFMLGLLRNLGDGFYVDDSEVDADWQAEPA